MLKFNVFENKDPVLQKHLGDYKDSLGCLNNEDTALDMLVEHQEYLISIKKAINAEKSKISKSREYDIIKPKILKNIGDMEKYIDEAIYQLSENFDHVLKLVGDTSRQILNALEKPFDFDKSVQEKEIKKTIRTLKEEKTLKSVGKMMATADKLYEMTGLDMKGKDLDKQTLMQYLLPDEINVKRWTLVNSWFNTSYGWGLNEHTIEFMGAKDSMQSKFPRGLDNPTMPIDYKLFHNGSMHSLKSAAILSKVLNRAIMHLERSNIEPEAKKELFNTATDLKPLAIAALLVHDSGEGRTGEVSVGNQLAKFNETANDEDKKKNKEQKDKYEGESFKKVVINSDEKAIKYYNTKPEDSNRVKKFVNKAYELAEHNDGPLNRILKLVEKMESNLEYSMRGENIASTFPANKDFNINYMTKVLYGTTIDSKRPGQNVEERTGLAATRKSDKFLARVMKEITPNQDDSLWGLIQKEKNPNNKKLFEFMYDEVVAMYQSTFKLYAQKNGVSDHTIATYLDNLEKGVGPQRGVN